MDVVSLKFRFNNQCVIPTFNYSSRMFTIERVKKHDGNFATTTKTIR